MFPILLSKRRDTAQPTSGKLFAWGGGGSGALGNEATANKSSPVQIGSNTNWVAATTCTSASFAVNQAGKAYAWGDGASGKTGLGNTTDYSSPVQIGSLTDWTPKGPWAIGGGTDVVHFIKSNGTLWAWGRNNGGKLGVGDTTTRSSPTQIAGTTWKHVSNSGGETSAIRTDGTLWSWGYGTAGRTGHNNTTSYSSPVQVGGLSIWKHNSQGSSAMTLTRTDGKMFTCGFAHTVGQLGHGNTTNYSSPKQVGALTTWAHTLGATYWNGAVKTDGTLWTWGSGGSGRGGRNNTTTVLSPVQVTAPSVSWKYAVGGQYLGQAVTTDGFVWTWGQGGSGQIGNSAASNVSSPVQLGTEKWVSLSYVTHCQQTHLLGIRP